MSEERTSLEIIAPSIEEAVANGLEELGLTEDEVEVEVLDSGSKGLFGLGTRQARIRLTVKGEADWDDIAEDEEASIPVPMPLPVSAAEIPSQALTPVVEVEETEDDLVLSSARETVRELLKLMRVQARVTARYVEPEEDESQAPVLVDVTGEDLSILIGPRAETLTAFQYITHQIVTKELGHPVHLTVDVQGYRARREQQVRQLARRMAEQAVNTGRRQVLEPMPPNERRFVHIELRSNPNVTTESIGEEPRRKVTIVPK